MSAACSAVSQLACHVPLLPETVRRLLLPPYMAHHVQYLKADRQHGAAELAAYVLQVCADTCGSRAWEATCVCVCVQFRVLSWLCTPRVAGLEAT